MKQKVANRSTVVSIPHASVSVPQTKIVALLRCVCLIVCTVLMVSLSHAWDQQSKLNTAKSLANILTAARAVIANHQPLINDETRSQKGLTGIVVVQEILEILRNDGSVDIDIIRSYSQQGRLLRMQLDAIEEVMDESQALINQFGVGYKGFVPSLFTQRANERLGAKAGEEVIVKVTAPTHLLRNRKSKPDEWEKKVMVDKFSSSKWTKGKLYSQLTTIGTKSAFRVLVPEYYDESCLSCHGKPAGKADITGYPKEGGTLGELGGAISIILFD